MGVWRERSPFGSSAVEVGSFMEPGILEERRGENGGRRRATAGDCANAVLTPDPLAELATWVNRVQILNGTELLRTCSSVGPAPGMKRVLSNGRFRVA